MPGNQEQLCDDAPVFVGKGGGSVGSWNVDGMREKEDGGIYLSFCCCLPKTCQRMGGAKILKGKVIPKRREEEQAFPGHHRGFAGQGLWDYGVQRRVPLGGISKS